jgi:dienelactone hydrolase
MPGGYDGTAEELYAPRLGDRAPPVVDLIAARADVDASRLILLGRSFGGYLAPRAAGHEHRFAALVVDPGQYDIGASLDKRLPGDLVRYLEDDSPAADELFEDLLREERYRRLFLPRMVTHGASTVRQYLKMMRAHTNAGHAEKITSPTLVCDNETDSVSTMQGRLLYDRLTCPKTFVRFTAAEGAEGHCQGLGQTMYFARMFDCIDEALGH